MKLAHIAIAVAGLLATWSMTSMATPQVLTRDATRDVITGATGAHYYLDHRKWYALTWHDGGTVEAREMDAKPDAKPLYEGKWRIKEVTPVEDESDESVAKRNAELDYVYCHQFEHLFAGHELCFEVEQETFHTDKDDDNKLLATQRYKMYREAGAQTGEYVITRR